MLIASEHACCHDIVCRIRDEELKRRFIAGVQAALEFTCCTARNNSIAPPLFLHAPRVGNVTSLQKLFDGALMKTVSQCNGLKNCFGLSGGLWQGKRRAAVTVLEFNQKSTEYQNRLTVITREFGGPRSIINVGGTFVVKMCCCCCCPAARRHPPPSPPADGKWEHC
jgi:hypothetical protein